MKSFMTMMMAAVAIVLGVSSCSNDDDEPEVPAAAQVVGNYTGPEVIKVEGEEEESSNETKTYVFAKMSDTSIDMTVPEMGMGMMTIPSFSVKNIPLVKSGKSIIGSISKYDGTVINAAGAEKNFTITKLLVSFEDVPKGKAVAVTFSLKYGAMPMAMMTTFTGDRNK